MLDEKNVKLFTSHKVLTETELKARHEVRLENYCKVVNIEALTMLDMVRKDILPAMSAYSAELASDAAAKTALLGDADCSYEKESVKSLSALLGATYRSTKKLESDLLAAKSETALPALADIYKGTILDDMRALRISVDEMETIASAKAWPYPCYGDLLFGVR